MAKSVQPKSRIIREMTADEFAQRQKREEATDKRFALFLGAGCSVTSGIPAAGSLVKDRWLPRLRDVQAPARLDVDKWATAEIPGYKPDDPGASYGELINRVFVTQEDRQREIESLCDGRSPSFGYAVLAQLVALPAGRFNVVLTTNFDDMVADALYLYTEARPLVIQHDSLAAFIRPTRTRPLVVKLHGDHRLSPRNTAVETAKLEEQIRRQTAMVLHDRGIIFIGYGGADRGIHRLLNELPQEALPYGAYWVHPNPPAGPIRDWLAEHGGVWVRSGWFDEVMLLIRNALELPHPDESRFTRIFADYQKNFQALSKTIQAKPATAAGARVLKAAVTTTEASFPDHWKAVSEALRLEHTAPAEANDVYRRAIEQFPKAAPLLGNYALFLADTRKELPAADAMFKRAIDADPKDADYLCNYAIFLDDLREDVDAAEAMYKRAIEVDPKHANSLNCYAIFLADVRKDSPAADAMFTRAINADPKNADNLCNYAIFLDDLGEDGDAAEAMYKRAIEADPKHASSLSRYAIFLDEAGKDLDTAEAVYKRAIAADPKDANTLGNYAVFLQNVRRDLDAAEAMYKQAIKADPKDADHFGKYATFLDEVRKDPPAADAMYKRAIEADPADAGHLGDYAIFLDDVQKDFDAADAMYKRAIGADPDDANTLGNYAIFLQNVRGDFGAAEVVFKRAIKADPDDASTLGNYAGLLLALGQRSKGMKTLEKALSKAEGREPGAIDVECLFYLYAHGPVRRRNSSLGTLKQLLQRGISSPGWDLSRNVARATQDGHPEAQWLSRLTAVINGAAEPSSLQEWPAWQSAMAREHEGSDR